MQTPATQRISQPDSRPPGSACRWRKFTLQNEQRTRNILPREPAVGAASQPHGLPLQRRSPV